MRNLKCVIAFVFITMLSIFNTKSQPTKEFETAIDCSTSFTNHQHILNMPARTTVPLRNVLIEEPGRVETAADK